MHDYKIEIYIYNKIFYISSEEAAKKPVRPMAQAPEGEGCPRCGAYVYAAEQMLARGRVSAFTLIISNTYSNFKSMK